MPLNFNKTPKIHCVAVSVCLHYTHSWAVAFSSLIFTQSHLYAQSAPNENENENTVPMWKREKNAKMQEKRNERRKMKWKKPSDFINKPTSITKIGKSSSVTMTCSRSHTLQHRFWVHGPEKWAFARKFTFDMHLKYVYFSFFRKTNKTKFTYWI